MFFDNYLSYHHKIMIAVICSGIWIFFRTSDCYAMIPRNHLFPVFFVMSWTYLNYYEPLMLPLGLLCLLGYTSLHKRHFFLDFFK
jgi:hypothetical protein